MAQDSSQEHQCIADIATLSSDFSKSLDHLKGQVDEIVKKYAITDEERLAISQQIEAWIEASPVEMSYWGFPFSCGVCQEKFEKKAEITDHIKYSMDNLHLFLTEQA